MTMATVQTAATTISAAVPYLQAITSAMTTKSKTPPDVSNKIQAAMSGVNTGVAALAASETAAQSRPIVQLIETDGMAVFQTAVASGLLPPPWNTVAEFALPLFKSAITLVNAMIATKTTVKPVAPVPAAA
jgi:hypothetical protein